MASAFSMIIVDIEKFFAKTGTDLEKFGTAFQHLFGKAPQALQAVDNFIGELAPVVEGAVALADPVLEGPVADALSIVETGLAALQAAASAANSGTSFLGNLQAFARQVPALLTGIEVKNPALQAKVTGIVNLVTNEAKVLIPAVQSWVAQLAAKTPAAPAA